MDKLLNFLIYIGAGIYNFATGTTKQITVLTLSLVIMGISPIIVLLWLVERKRRKYLEDKYNDKTSLRKIIKFKK